VARKPVASIDPHAARPGVPYRGRVPLWSSSTDRWSLSAQIFVLMALMLVVVVVPVWLLSVRAAEEAARAEAIAHVTSTATTLAESPWVIQAVQSEDPAEALGEPIERIRAANDLSFVVVMDVDGTRWTHPNPEQVGRQYVGSIAAAQAGGEVGEETQGTMGPSFRVVHPVRSDGRVIAMVAAGIPTESVRQAGMERSVQVVAITVASLALGTVGSWVVARRLRRQTLGLGSIGLGRLYSYHEALLHSVRAGLVLVGHDGAVVLCNDEARELLDASGAVLGTPVAQLGIGQGLSDLMASGRVCAGETHFTAGGRALIVTQTRAVLDGRDLGWVTTLQDRTDLVRLTGELDSLRSFSEMLRSRAHEADNRLHTVILLVELGRGEEAVEFATAAIERSQALIDRVTEAVRDAPVAALLLGKSAQAEERGVELRLADGIDIPETGLASTDLVLVLGNLVDNALDAAASTERGWVEVGGRLERSGQEETVVMEVTDSGPGIPGDLIGDAFRRGWTTKSVTDPDLRPQGHGIGLSLVAGTVRRLHGTIEVTTSPSRFAVRLPVPESNDEVGP